MNEQEKITNNISRTENTESLNNTLNEEYVPVEATSPMESPKPARKPRKKPTPAAEAETASQETSDITAQVEETSKPVRKPRKKPTPAAEAETASQETSDMTAQEVEETPKPARKPRKKPVPAAEVDADSAPLSISASPSQLEAPAEALEATLEAVESIPTECEQNENITKIDEEPAADEVMLSEKDADEAPTPEKNDEDIILPPDEIFSVPIKKKEDEYEEPEEECIDDDGQYRFSAIEETAEETADDDEEAVELDYSEPSQEKYNEKKPRGIDGKFDFIELFVFTFLAVIIITSFFFKHSVVDGVSMEQTLSHGEHLIISDLFYTPKRGDVIVCEDYTTQIRKPIVKRVIGIEGDTIRITSDGNVYVNDSIVPIDESDYVFIDDPNYQYTSRSWKVGKNELFVMGDHRNQSTDSRVIGTVSEDSVLGKVILRFYPFDKFGAID